MLPGLEQPPGDPPGIPDIGGPASTTPIVAARYVEVEDGQLLLLWVRQVDDQVELELGYDDDLEEDTDDDFGFPDMPE